MYRFALRPRWIVMHLLVLSMVALFAVAGFWQLHRLRERRDHNEGIQAALAAPAVDLRERPVAGGPVHVTADGTYDTEREVVLVNRSLDEQAGNHIVTPLVLGKGRAVLVDRGWVPPDERAEPVAQRVSIEGVYLPPEPKRPLAPDDPPAGTLDTIRRIVPSRLEGQMPYELDDGFVLLQRQTPPQTALPRPVPPPALGEGSHFAYAVQWFAFIPIALTVYVLLLRQQARKRGVLSSAHA